MTTILYITFSKRTPAEYYRDASVIYRCFQPCEYWRSVGHQSYVMHHDDAVQRQIAADVVVFHRPRAGASFLKLRQMYAGCRCVADYDDCLFDESILNSHPALLSGTTSMRVLKQQTKEYYAAFSTFDTYCVSTDGIREAVKSLNSDATTIVVRNGISPFWRNLDGVNVGTADKKIISYFSGTANHSADLALHIDAISDASSACDDFEVHVYGQLKLNQTLPSNWKRLAPVAFHLLPQLIKQSWICIAPVVDNPFNRCKSAIKYLESASFGKPLITQPLPEFNRLNAPGLFLTESDWHGTISKLLAPSVYQESAASAAAFADGHLVHHQMQEMAPWI